ncbi:MAG: hypothetical protein AAF602_17690 [Myxococcota bacterium]
MTKTLRRLARIQRIYRDEARSDFASAQRVKQDHDIALRDCEAHLQETRQAPSEDADELMRRHAYTLRQEMRRRALEAKSEPLDAWVEQRRTTLLDAARRFETTERYADRIEETVAEYRQRRDQRRLDEAGQQVWLRRQTTENR